MVKESTGGTTAGPEVIRTEELIEGRRVLLESFEYLKDMTVVKDLIGFKRGNDRWLGSHTD